MCTVNTKNMISSLGDKFINAERCPLLLASGYQLTDFSPLMCLFLLVPVELGTLDIVLPRPYMQLRTYQLIKMGSILIHSVQITISHEVIS